MGGERPSSLHPILAVIFGAAFFACGIGFLIAPELGQKLALMVGMFTFAVLAYANLGFM